MKRQDSLCRFAAAVIFLFSAFALCGCSSTTSASTSGTTSGLTASSTVLSTSSVSTTVGSSVTLTATVSPAAATGTVTFYSGTTVLGSGALNAGAATLVTSFSAAGTYTVTASYAGSSTYAASTSSGLSITVNATTSTTPSISMVAVPGGTFFDGVADMTISTGYQMAVYPITQAQYQAVMGANPSTAGSGTSNPVDNVTWYQALVFCNTLSIAEGLTPVYSINGSTNPSAWPTLAATGANLTWDEVTMVDGANGYRLPTASEWLWAAMGGLSDAVTSDISNGINVGGYLKGYAGSAENGGGQTNAAQYCWYSANSSGVTQPVGTKKANELGLYDMCGNVSEWVFDYYWGENENGAVGFLTTNQTDYTGLPAGTAGTDGKWRWLLGGSYSDTASSLVVLSQDEAFNPSITHNFGFRVVKGGVF